MGGGVCVVSIIAGRQKPLECRRRGQVAQTFVLCSDWPVDPGVAGVEMRAGSSEERKPSITSLNPALSKTSPLCLVYFFGGFSEFFTPMCNVALNVKDSRGARTHSPVYLAFRHSLRMT